MGLFRLLRNIEDDFITSNSAVAFSMNKTSNYLYRDRHGNWLVGKWVGEPRGVIRSNPKAGKDLECPCKVGTHGDVTYITCITYLLGDLVNL